MKNIVVRALSGAIYVGLIVVSIVMRKTLTDWIFLTVFSLFIALGIHEIHHVAKKEGGKSPLLLQLLDIAGGIGLFGALYLQTGGHGGTALWLVPLAAYFLLRAIVQLYMPRHDALLLSMRSALSILYVAMPVSLLHAISALTDDRLILAMFIFIWIFDTGAFLVGTAIGRHRLFERVSPKKSWEGVAGGVLACLAVAWLLPTYAGDFFSGPLSIWFWVGMAVVVAVFATFGDLFESLLKRTVRVKDSGNLIPGHGGILDRIDSLLFAAPALLIYVVIYQALC